jgi:hypothetical protein
LHTVLLFNLPTFFYIGYHFFENRHDISSSVASDLMGVLNKPGSLFFQFFHYRNRNLQPLILPNQQSHGQTFFLLSDKSHLVFPPYRLMASKEGLHIRKIASSNTVLGFCLVVLSRTSASLKCSNASISSFWVYFSEFNINLYTG